MKDFSEFENFIRSDEFAKKLSEHLTKNLVKMPAIEQLPDEYSQNLANFIALLSGEVSLAFLKTYHQWIVLQSKN